MGYFKLPDLGEGLQEAEIIQWHVQAGDTVAVDQLLLSVETAKAIVDIPSPQAGNIAQCFVQPGDLVHTGEPLLAFADDGERSHSVVGKLEEDSSASEPTAQSQAEQDHFIIGAAPGNDSAAATTPAIRALARHLNVSLEQINGSGPGGTISLDDVQQAARLVQSHGDSSALRGVARSMAQTMAKAGSQVVPVSLFDQVAIGHWPEQTDITLRLIRAIVAGVTAEPIANAWFDGERLRIRQIQHIDLGIAVDTPDGLFVPVLRDVGNRPDSDLREGLNRLREDVRQRKIPASELQGATLTLSNFGTLAGRFATPVVVPPQVVIIGAGRRFSQPALANGKLVEDLQLPLSLSFDHRALNGGQAARFLAAMLTELSR